LRSNAGSLSSRTGQPERRHVVREGGTLPVRASSWCSRDGHSHKVGWRSSKTGMGSSHFAVLGKASRWTWK
jgi:hypothetical protein